MPNNNEISLERPKGRILLRRPYSIFNTMMDDFMDDFFSNRLAQSSFISPKVNLIDKGDRFLLEAELPGMQKKDIDVEVLEDRIVLNGERKTSEEHKEENYYHKETSYGKIHREIGLPEKINAELVVASYEEGMLKVELPKAVATKAKKLVL